MTLDAKLRIAALQEFRNLQEITHPLENRTRDDVLGCFIDGQRHTVGDVGHVSKVPLATKGVDELISLVVLAKLLPAGLALDGVSNALHRS